MPDSILDKVKITVTNPDGGGYKGLASTAFAEIIGDLRERLRDQRDIAGMLKSQVEALQTDLRRANDKLDKFEMLAGQMQRHLLILQRKLRALNVDPDALLIEDGRSNRGSTDGEDSNKGE